MAYNNIDTQVIKLAVEADPTTINTLTRYMAANEQEMKILQAAYASGVKTFDEFEKEASKLVTTQNQLKVQMATAAGGFNLTGQQAMAAGYMFQDFASASGGLAQKLNSVTNNIPQLLGNIGMLGPAITTAAVIVVEFVKHWDDLSKYFTGEKLKLGDFTLDLGTMGKELKAAQEAMEKMAESTDKSASALKEYLTARQKIAEAEERIAKAEKDQQSFTRLGKAHDDEKVKERVKELKEHVGEDEAKAMERDLTQAMFEQAGGLKKQGELEDALHQAEAARKNPGATATAPELKRLSKEVEKRREDLDRWQAGKMMMREKAHGMVNRELEGENTGALKMLPQGPSRDLLLDAYRNVDKLAEENEKEFRKQEKDEQGVIDEQARQNKIEMDKHEKDVHKAVIDTGHKALQNIPRAVGRFVHDKRRERSEQERAAKSKQTAKTRAREHLEHRTAQRQEHARPVAEQFAGAAALLYGGARQRGAEMGANRPAQARLDKEADAQLKALLNRHFMEQSHGNVITSGPLAEEAYKQVRSNYNARTAAEAGAFRQQGAPDPMAAAQMKLMQQNAGLTAKLAEDLAQVSDTLTRAQKQQMKTRSQQRTGN
jgi:hypothetical protein